MKKFLTTAVIGCLLSSYTMAANEQIPTDKTIIAIHTFVDGATITYSPSHSDNLGCNGTDALKAVHVDWSQDGNYKAMFSTALAAYSSGKTVGFGVNGCWNGFGGSVPKAYRIDVKD